MAKLSQENNETAAMLVKQKIPLGIGLSFHANVSFPFIKSTWSLMENHLQDEIKYSHGPLRNHYKSTRTLKQQQVSLT